MTSRRNAMSALGLGAAGLLWETGCGGEKKRIIGVVPKGRAHLFWQSVQAGAIAASRETAVEISWNGPATETDFNAQLQIVDSMINRRVDAICLAPIDKKAMVSVVERAAAQKIPVIIFDSPIDTDKFVSQIATDNYAAGAMAADRMGEILGGKGEVVIVAVQPGAASTMARESGFEETLAKKFPGIKILDKRYGMADYAKSLAVTENMLTAHPGATGLFASNESSAAGAAQCLRSRGGKIKMVGFDSSAPLIEDLRKGIIDSLVVQQPFKMGYESVIAAVNQLAGKPVEKIQNLEPKLVTAQNVDTPEIKELVNPDLKKYLP
ncbi:substrate-binding domain-containing protein [Bryobacter aggregatus]|uniref:substrate-binding domain-containing protein n=1 Tax=Bryobacter aggregatus TaxID=360054 RepID=UPI0009B5CE30|nr:substrate-binding domain-containing protein [Bryobacter aggregatus]